CSRRIAMICSSVKRLGFMSFPRRVMDSTHFWRKFRGSGQCRTLTPFLHLGEQLTSPNLGTHSHLGSCSMVHGDVFMHVMTSGLFDGVRARHVADRSFG